MVQWSRYVSWYRNFNDNTIWCSIKYSIIMRLPARNLYIFKDSIYYMYRIVIVSLDLYRDTYIVAILYRFTPKRLFRYCNGLVPSQWSTQKFSSTRPNNDSRYFSIHCICIYRNFPLFLMTFLPVWDEWTLIFSTSASGNKPLPETMLTQIQCFKKKSCRSTLPNDIFTRLGRVDIDFFYLCIR